MENRKYSLRDGPFFRLKTKKKLAELLLVSLGKLKRLAAMQGGYIKFKQKKKSGGLRDISAPIPPLKETQARIANLFGRVMPPDYLFAPVQGRSYVSNAARHVGAKSVRLLDIRDFFPSCTTNKVIWFFSKRLECSPDVSAILARIVTEKGSLPQGSPCSPILAFMTYIDMWEEIEARVTRDGCVLSVYADDITISGETVPEAMIWEIKGILRKHGHEHAADKERARRHRSAEITGVILTKGGITPPNRQRQKLHAAKNALSAATSPIQIASLEAQLRGREAQIRQIESAAETKEA